jgi:hypothetical protein
MVQTISSFFSFNVYFGTNQVQEQYKYYLVANQPVVAKDPTRRFETNIDFSKFISI